jgi:hypothetical protein
MHHLCRFSHRGLRTTTLFSLGVAAASLVADGYSWGCVNPAVGVIGAIPPPASWWQVAAAVALLCALGAIAASLLVERKGLRGLILLESIGFLALNLTLYLRDGSARLIEWGSAMPALPGLLLLVGAGARLTALYCTHRLVRIAGVGDSLLR